MSNYYTSFFRRGDRVYIREITSEGKRNNYSVEYKPKLYFATDDPNCGYATLDGRPLREVEFSSMSNAKEYSKVYDGDLFGFNRYEYACINDLYPDHINYSMDNLRVGFLDIETCSDGGFSTIENPYQQINLIQFMYRGVIYIFGLNLYESYTDKVKFVKCSDEVDLLTKFVKFFRKVDPDIISGWNSSGYDMPMMWARMTHLEMESEFKKMSPFNMIEVYDDIVFGKPQKRVELRGIQHLDYMNLFKKFDQRRFVDYKLNTVAEKVINRGKVKYDGSLSQLYHTDYNKFVEYGLTDVDLLDEMDKTTQHLELVVMLGYKSKTNFEDAFYQVRMWDCTFYDYLKNVKNIQVPFDKHEFKENLDYDEEMLDDVDEKYEGAYVKPPVSGKYKWIMSDDVQSLYPSLMMGWNMSPETYCGKDDINVDYVLTSITPQFTQRLKDDNIAIASNGAKFIRDFKGFIPEVLEGEFNARVSAKNTAKKAKKRCEEIQNILDSNEPHDRDALLVELKTQKMVQSINGILDKALKVRINSAYGAIGNPHFRFYKKDIAEAITLTGQTLLKLIDRDFNAYMNSQLKNSVNKDYIIYQDTDSAYISLEDVVNNFVPKDTPVEKVVEFLDRYHDKYLKPIIDKTTEDMQKTLNVFEYKLKFVRDVIADVGIFLSKKRYVLQVWDVEGVRYKSPELKQMGVETVKSSTPDFCKQKIQHAINLMLNSNNDELIDYLQEVEQEYYKLPPEKMASPRGISNLDKWVKMDKKVGVFSDENEYVDITHESRTPFHVKGAIVFNNLINKFNLTNVYQPFTNGDKIKFVYLKEPNPTKNNGISFDETIPEEFGLKSYIDYELQYEKTLLAPIRAIADVIKWETSREEGAIF